MTNDTRAEAYARRLERKQHVWWKRVLPVQLPYRWNLHRQHLGVTLDVGCGLGRNLAYLPKGSIGVDHNARAVASARARGLDAMTVDEFERRGPSLRASFDSLLVAHVIEHLTQPEAEALLASYRPYLKPGGKVFLVCPQERGYRSDPTHVWFAVDRDLEALCRRSGLVPARSYSFPLPRRLGNVFVYNETCVLAIRE
jgi:SAM-dependent methyltransferase